MSCPGCKITKRNARASRAPRPTSCICGTCWSGTAGSIPKNIQVVADSLPWEFAEKAGVDCKVDPNNSEKRVGSGCPNRQDILNALDTLVARAKSGDFVYIHFSGHGIRVPTPKDQRDREPDHFDEAFVPIDVAKFDFSHGSVPGLILDDEIGERLRTLRKNGVFVWFVADSCHSGGLSRGPADRGQIGASWMPGSWACRSR